MAKVLTIRRPFARLSFADGEVIVTPKDRSLFLINAEKATEACREMVQREEGIQRFESEFLVPLHDWCVAEAERIRACYIPLPGTQIQVFIVTYATPFDFDLAERMAELGLRLARAGWPVSIMQLPGLDDESMTAFFKPEGALEVYAKRGPASTQGGE